MNVVESVQYGQRANLIAGGNWRQAGHARRYIRRSPVAICNTGLSRDTKEIKNYVQQLGRVRDRGKLAWLASQPDEKR